jgi:uncharacterized protein
MTVYRLAHTLAATALILFAAAATVRAQSAQPSAASVAIAKEIVALKGATNMFDTVVPGVIEHHKRIIMQANPNLQRDLDEVGARLLKEFSPRTAEVQLEIARGYASRFTEQELKDILAFYKTPLGKKLITEEPQGVDEATRRVDNWAAKYAEDVLTRLRAEMKKKGHDL